MDLDVLSTTLRPILTRFPAQRSVPWTIGRWTEFRGDEVTVGDSRGGHGRTCTSRVFRIWSKQDKNYVSEHIEIKDKVVSHLRNSCRRKFRERLEVHSIYELFNFT